MLNQKRLEQAREYIRNAAIARLLTPPGWRAGSAHWLARAATARRDARLSWDFTVALWVCPCCMFSLANGECCADDIHGGDGVPPLSEISPDDSVSLGMVEEEHSEYCARDDGGDECDCEHNPFSAGRCDGCGSWLAGSRYAATLFVNDRRNVSSGV